MHTRSLWLAALGLALLFAMRSSPPGVAGQAGMAEPDPAMAAKNEAAPGATLGHIEPMADTETVGQAKDPVGLVGTIIAVVPVSRTVVVDVPLEKDVLRVGASITAGTIIKAGAAAAPFEALEVGVLVRIHLRRVPKGNEAVWVEVLEAPQG